MRTRQVEQRPRPPQTAACGMLPMRLASRIVLPGWMLTVLPSGYATRIARCRIGPVADVAAGQHGEDDDRIADQTHVEPVVELRHRLAARQVAPDRHLVEPARLLGEIHHLARRLREAEQGQEREQEGGAVERHAPFRKPGLQPQPEPEADAAMGPGDQHRDGLHRDELPIGGERQHRLLIGVVEAEDAMRHGGAEEVQSQ